MTATVGALREKIKRACRENPHLTSRLEKAAFLVLLRAIEHLGGENYRVRSEDGLRWYYIRAGHCECHDYVNHGVGHPCKHKLAIDMLHHLG